MHLKTLTLKGFKSFASATTLRLEPGITCVVGPNGSGKSNVVDALAWVMGEQGAKSLRGGKMEDVIFAGTSGRPPLGRAEVSLTIDNTDGALPIDYTEVTITRTMFRSGGSEYSINGDSARLLDVQELLSDSGIGREMHVIVGQNQLDAVLRATPEDRRGFIEEAAGILKHRKRKEKALRKIDAMQVNLNRVTDLTSEIRRQLGPLGRQARVARRAQVIQTNARDAKARLLADDLAQLTATLAQDVADESALQARRTEVEKLVTHDRTQLAQWERDAAEAVPRLTKAIDTWYTLSQLRERMKATVALADQRRRLLADPEPETPSDRDPDALTERADAAERDLNQLTAGICQLNEALDAQVQARAEAERAAHEFEQRVAAQLRAAADRREGLARLAGQVAAKRSSLEALTSELSRVTSTAVESRAKADETQREFTVLESQIAGEEEGEVGLDNEYERAANALSTLDERIKALTDAEREIDKKRAGLQARLEALRLSMTRNDAGDILLASDSSTEGVLGAVATLITVEAGRESHVSLALGAAAGAIAVRGLDSAVEAIQLVRERDGGRADLLVTGAPATSRPQVDLPAQCQWTADCVTGDDDIAVAARNVLSHSVFVPDLDTARRVVSDFPTLCAITDDGDIVAFGISHSAGESTTSLIAVQAAIEETEAEIEKVGHDAQRLTFELTTLASERQEVQADVDAALEQLHESDARLASVAEQLGHLGSVMRSANAEADRAEKNIERLQGEIDTGNTQLAELAERLHTAESTPQEAEPDTTERDSLNTAASSARAAETDARLKLRTEEERAHALRNRVKSLRNAAHAERAARERLAQKAKARREAANRAHAVHRAATELLTVAESELQRAAHGRDSAEAERAARDEALARVRLSINELSDELTKLTDEAHRDEVARTQQRLRIEAVETKAVDELGLDPKTLIDEFGPDQMITPAPEPRDDGTMGEPGEPYPFVREQQEKRLKKAERELRQLGRVNPLALEEFSALEERHKFLTTQMEDLKKSRKDLLDIVDEVDKRVLELFGSAWEDTQREFADLFPRLFPGGEGRLVLTEPNNLLTTGIEVEARPAGKKVKRLSLLSGGERSLTAVALLVAIFKARPSPFYVLDEVEAALDDTNLGRLIAIMAELRDSSQLIVITHQKRTMEVADALYGVTMRGDGVTKVVSQRLREETPA